MQTMIDTTALIQTKKKASMSELFKLPNLFMFSDLIFLRNNSIFLNYMLHYTKGKGALENCVSIKTTMVIGKNG